MSDTPSIEVPLYFIEYEMTPAVPPEIIAVLKEEGGIVFGILVSSYLTPDLVGMAFESSADSVREDFFEGVIDFTKELRRYNIDEPRPNLLDIVDEDRFDSGGDFF